MAGPSAYASVRAGQPSAAEVALIPSAVDPFRSGAALPLLASYRDQTWLNDRDYAEQVLAQRQLEQYKLAEQGRQHDLTAITSALGQETPGSLETLISSGLINLPRYAGGQTGVASPANDVRNQYLARSADAKILDKVLSAAYSGVQSGFVPPTAQTSQLAGMPLQRQTPLQLMVAQLHEAAANARHKDPTDSYSFQFQTPPGAPTITGTAKYPRGTDTNVVLQDATRRQAGIAGGQLTGANTSAGPVNPAAPGMDKLNQYVQEKARGTPMEAQGEMGRYGYKRLPNGDVQVLGKTGALVGTIPKSRVDAILGGQQR